MLNTSYRTYYETITEALADAGITDVDPRHVEGWMRTSFSSLDAIDRDDFAYEVECAARCAMESDAHLNDEIANIVGI